MFKEESKDIILNLLRDELLFKLTVPGRYSTAINGLMLTRIDRQSAPEKCLYYPLIALVVQGTKQAFYGEKEVSYGAGEYVVLCNDMPGVYHIIDSSPQKPFLSVSIRLDPRIIASIIIESGDHSDINSANSYPAITKETASIDLLLAFYRLLRLVDKPDEISIFGNSLLREIHHAILKGSTGDKVRMAMTPGTRDNRIANAIAWLRIHFRDNCSMPDLARHVNMAPSTFNRYFRELTSISPLQFQKRLRLYEAQRLMFMENRDARSAAEAVGYESEAQFSCEYKRLFGQPPAQDAANSHH